ncbi:hypothetical protein ACOMHN_003111 [Nucella lapillus]
MGPRVLLILILSAIWSSNLTQGQTTPPSTPTTPWTFNEPGVSHITFSPPLTDSQTLRLELSFRTLQANGMIVYQDVAEDSVKKLDEHGMSSLLESFHLFVALRQGYLKVGHKFDHYNDVLSIGRALNDDEWHRMTLVMNQTSGELSVALDTDSATLFLKAFIWGNAREELDWATLTTSIRLGGAKGASDHTSFVGCLGDLRYSTDPSPSSLQPVPVDTREGVAPGCLNKCEGGGEGGGGGQGGEGKAGGGRKCENNGRCVNLYTGYHCDCFGTDFQGRNCETEVFGHSEGGN